MSQEQLGTTQTGDLNQDREAGKYSAERAALYALLESRDGGWNIRPGSPEALAVQKNQTTILDLWDLAERKMEGEENIFEDFPDSNRLVTDEDGHVIPIQRAGDILDDNNMKGYEPAIRTHYTPFSKNPRDAASYEGARIDDILAAIERQIIESNSQIEAIVADQGEDAHAEKVQALKVKITELEAAMAEKVITSDRDRETIDQLMLLVPKLVDGQVKEYTGPIYRDQSGSIASRDRILKEANRGKPMPPEEAVHYGESVFAAAGYENLGVVSTASPETFLGILERQIELAE